MIFTKREFIILLVVFGIGIAFGVLITGSFSKKMPDYVPDASIEYIKSENIKLKDSISRWQIEYKKTDSIYRKTETEKQNIKFKYEKLRKQITDANATDGTTILDGFLTR